MRRSLDSDAFKAVHPEPQSKCTADSAVRKMGGIYQKKPVPRTLGTLSSCTEVSNNDNVNGFVPQIASLAKQLEQTASSKEWLELQVLSLQKEMESMGAASSTAPAGVSPSKAEVMKKLSLLRVIGCAFYSGRVSPSISGVDKLMTTIG